MISMTVLDTKARAAAATRGRVWVGHLESGASKILDIIYLASLDELQAYRVDDKRHAVCNGNDIVLLKVA